MADYLSSPRLQFFDTATNLPLAGGAVYVYAAGTTTPLATYPTLDDFNALTNAQTHPVILDSRGEATIVLSGASKIVLKDSAGGNTIWTVDDVNVSTGDILDSSGNEIIKLVGVAGAVNEITVTNAATGSSPSIAATGNDTNIGLGIRGKGSGVLTLQSSGGQTTVSGALAASSTLNVTGALTAGSTLAVTGATTLSSTLAVSGAITANSTFNLLPSGMIMYSALSSPPTGWLLCNGTNVSRTTYASLFAAIGTTFGAGDGSTTFGLPNQARRVVVGAGGSGTATLSNTVGSTGGSETHTLDLTEIPAHTHTYSRSDYLTNIQAGASYTGTTGVSTQTSSSSGGGGAHNNMQPSLVLNMMIKT